MEKFTSQPDEYALVAEFYDHVAPYGERQDVAFFVEQARKSGGPVLEIGCGTGRVLIPTAKSGLDIVGLDFSEAMLAVCREKLAAEPDDIRARVQLVSGDMRDFELKQRFALVTIPFRPFQHLVTVADQLRCLATIHHHLQPGGRLILDIFNPLLDRLSDESDIGLEKFEEDRVTLADGRQLVRSHRIVARDLLNQIQDIELIYNITQPNGQQDRFVHTFQMRYLFRFEAEHLLTRAGFTVEAVYADYDKTPYGAKYPGELIFVAVKI